VAQAQEGLLRRVVQLATGAWFDPQDPAVPGSLELNGNPNVLTADHGTSRLGQGPSPNSCLGDIRRFAGEAPPVRAYGAPDLVPDPRPAQNPFPHP
jgi:biotin/methionine sulfoxide reductase